MRKLLVVLVLAAVSPAFAGWTLYDITANPGAWANALAAYNLVADGGWDFSRDANYPIQGLYGPLDWTGQYPVSPGTIDRPGIKMYGRDYVYVDMDLATVGPQYGFGNPYNAVVANYFVDAFVLDIEGAAAVEFNVTSLLGGNSIQITVGSDVFSGTAGPAGRKYGLIAPNAAIGDFKVYLYDPAGGAEGPQGWGQVYIPEPASLALLGLAALVLRRR